MYCMNILPTHICKHVLVATVLLYKISAHLVLSLSQDISPKVCVK